MGYHFVRKKISRICLFFTDYASLVLLRILFHFSSVLNYTDPLKKLNWPPLSLFMLLKLNSLRSCCVMWSMHFVVPFPNISRYLKMFRVDNKVTKWKLDATCPNFKKERNVLFTPPMEYENDRKRHWLTPKLLPQGQANNVADGSRRVSRTFKLQALGLQCLCLLHLDDSVLQPGFSGPHSPAALA